MTKVSWKRILQRAGNDFPPSHGGGGAMRQRVEPFPGNMQPRPVRTAEGPPLVAGELESELRRALHRAQHSAANDTDDQPWEPIYMAQEMRHGHTVAAVPVTSYPEIQMQAKPRGGSTARNFIALSLTVAVLGIGVQQIGFNWGGGGGGGDNGGQQQEARANSIPVPSKKDQGKLVETGYAIQPLVHPGNPTEIGQGYSQNPPLLADEKPAKSEQSAADAAAAFKRDMEEAVKLFENKPAAAPAAARETATAREAAPARETAPARQIAAATPQEPAVVAPAPSSMPQLSSAEEEKLLQRATGLMQRGDITGARLLFEHLAFRGSALGAFALAQSYDQRYLEKLYVRGLAADQKQADYWYRRAAELGGTSVGVSASGRR